MTNPIATAISLLLVFGGVVVGVVAVGVPWIRRGKPSRPETDDYSRIRDVSARL